MSAWIIYGLVIIFLVAFPLLVLVLVQSSEASIQKQLSGVNTGHIDKVSYGAAGALLVLFAVLTFAIQRNKSS